MELPLLRPVVESEHSEDGGGADAAGGWRQSDNVYGFDGRSNSSLFESNFLVHVYWTLLFWCMVYS